MADRFFSPCPRGLEAMLADELAGLGASGVSAGQGGVAWAGDWLLAQRANLESRIATRVLWQVAEGRYRSEEDIYRLAYGVTWAKWFTSDETLRVNVTAQKSPLKSLEFTTLRIKDAICDHFRTVTGHRPDIDTKQPDVRVHAFLTRDGVSLYLDTSGEPLYKRGFKRARVEAPLKENLAAGILGLSGWRPGEALADPMCGSGTFLLEAAQIALDVAPGLGRRFAFERLRNFDRGEWGRVVREVQARRRPATKLPLFGADIAEDQLVRTRQNLDAAGFGDCVTLTRSDVLDLAAPAESGVMVTNPPYGVRLGEAEALAEFYPKLADALKRHWAGWRCYILSGDMNLPKAMRLKASKRTPLFNGALDCRLFEYVMVSGGMRDKPKVEN
ncbi:MAG: class I SAM-dependent RNA methyltransferase [Rhodocyclaceae bacterium]|nr:class I SAM-dependent RNA methyltransferase [Rhodocyclaceae bacterium]